MYDYTGCPSIYVTALDRYCFIFQLTKYPCNNTLEIFFCFLASVAETQRAVVMALCPSCVRQSVLR